MSRSDSYARGRRAGRGRGVLLRDRLSRNSTLVPFTQTPSALPSPIPEAALYPPIADYFAAQGFFCWREASFLGNWIDVYARRGDKTIAIEAKVRDWRRALRQAMLLRNSANNVYVALWAPYVHRAQTEAARSAFEAAGVGLISVNGGCELVVDAHNHQPRYPGSVLVSAASRIR